MKGIIKKIFWTLAVIILLLPAGVAFTAHIPAKECDGGLCNPIRYDTIKDFLTAMLDALIVIAFPFIVLAVVYAGFLFVSARGNEEKLKTAKRVFVWVIVGSLIILGASVLSNVIGGTVDKLKSGGGVSEYERIKTLENYGLPTGKEQFDPSRPESVFNPR
jgi:hypothetical protein